MGIIKGKAFSYDSSSMYTEKSYIDVCRTLFPTRCCRRGIPLTSAKLYLKPAFVCKFEQKTIEFKSPHRTYCSLSTCSSFITWVSITGEQATCTVCGTITCTICKSDAHSGDCPEDTATQQLLETAREEGWQLCYNCRRLVELDAGCNHMMYSFTYYLHTSENATIVTMKVGVMFVGHINAKNVIMAFHSKYSSVGSVRS